MKAWVLHGARDLRYESLAEPAVGAKEALVEVMMTGVCGSDLHAYHGTQPFFVYPQIPGHEVVGRVVAVGSDAPLSPGQRVVLDPTVNCGSCYACRIGRYNCCARIKVIGVHLPGTMAERFKAPCERLHVVPEGVTDEAAVLAEPLSIGLHAVQRGHVVQGDRVAIIGAGSIGQSVLLMARLRGARCLVADVRPQRLALARVFGAEQTVDASANDATEAVLAWTDGEGASVVFEAVGSVPTIRSSVAMAAAAGRVVILGLCADDVPLPGSVFVRKELDVIGSRLHGGTVAEVLRLLAQGRVEATAMIERPFPLTAAPEAFEAASAGAGESIKMLLGREVQGQG